MVLTATVTSLLPSSARGWTEAGGGGEVSPRRPGVDRRLVDPREGMLQRAKRMEKNVRTSERNRRRSCDALPVVGRNHM